MLLLISLLAADPIVVMRLADERMSALPAVAEAAAPRRSPYRLDPNVAGPADGKTAALATTGEKCSVTGARLCTKKPGTVFTASY